MRPNLTAKAQEIMQKSIQEFGQEPDAVIGIHGRFTDYASHLKLFGFKGAGSNYYAKAIEHFRKLYKKPLFLVCSDDPGRAKMFIFSSQKGRNDVIFAGTIEDAVEKKIR